MSVAAPTERAYYYECSGGKFRLTLFIPRGILVGMVDGGSVRADVLVDFPDGVDLDCTEADFDDFQRVYGYRPSWNADQLRAAFFAMFSTSRDWQSFRGTGFIRAEDLEENIEPIQQELESVDLLPPAVDGPPLDFEKRRQWVQAQAQQESRAIDLLKSLSVKIVDPTRTMQQQDFSKVPMEGRAAEDVFLHLHQKRGKRL
jgi:hypothetical protein